MNLHFDLDLDHSNPIFSQDTQAYDDVPTKFACKRISSSVDMVETVISDFMKPHCKLDPEDSKPILLYDTLANDDASPYKVCLQKVQQFRRYHPNKH